MGIEVTTRVAVTGGKTGGHVFPALAVIQTLPRSEAADRSAISESAPTLKTEVQYIGIKGGIEERVVPAAGLHLASLRLTTPDTWPRVVRALVEMPFQVAASLRLLRRFRPDVLFSTGGFVSLPATIAAIFRRTPIVIFLPDVSPGLTVRLTSHFATSMAVVDEATRDSLPSNRSIQVTGYPVRPVFRTLTRDAARERLGLSRGDKLLLVMGGSLGARSINQALAQHLSELLEAANVYHITGTTNLSAAEAAAEHLPPKLRQRYRLVASLGAEDIAAAMLAADLAVTRAGASILGELPAAALPAIVVPLPAPRVKQDENARALCAHGGCVVVEDYELDRSLVPLVTGLLFDSDRLSQMSTAMAAQARPEAAQDIGRLILQAAEAAS